MEKKILFCLATFWLLMQHSQAQVIPYTGLSVALNTSTMGQFGVEGGVTYGRFLAGIDYRYGELIGMNSFGGKIGVGLWRDIDKNDAVYLVVGASHDTWGAKQDRYSAIHPAILVRWQFYNAFCEGGRQNNGYVFTVGYDFKRIKR